MKKMLVVVIMMLASVATFAQTTPGRLTIQPKVGLSIATLTDFKGSDPRFGVVTGAEMEYSLTDMIALSGGVLYSMQGCKYENSGVSVTEKLDYINIPILCNVYVVKGLAVKLGIQPGFNINSTAKGSGVEIDEDGVKTVDFSIPVGLSYEFNNFVIDGRYNWGLTKVADNVDCKNSVWQITLGYKFEL